MRICVVASSRFPIAEPFAGGLEAMTHGLTRELVRRGHEVTLFAAPGSDPSLPVHHLEPARFEVSKAAMADVNAPSSSVLTDHHAYLDLMLRLQRTGAERFDVVHNNSLHHLPVAMAPAVPVPIVTTLHTPPLPYVESAVHLGAGASTFVAVSGSTAAAWSHVVPSTVVPNGVDLSRWRFGTGGGPAVWSGRLVPEKAPHEAIDACRRAGVPLVLVGPAHDPRYYEREVAPRLGRGVEYRGHLDHSELAHLLRRASVALVTPAWDEPYGLVASEAMASGTPVAGYARGGLPEVVGTDGGVLVAPGDVVALAGAVREARGLDRAAVRRHAERTCSLEVMVDGYERAYRELVHGPVAA
ncbi:glycosyltransferase family 4 protein [Nocardioides litoris]|uniref:glycosyltransferase family 4 protein n=1 Tax=Nocardioides litoris TaxID=1926648 RepID=UPI001FE6EF2C|nr:glycosyltransferase family 4 protein [Nocardioides litoris]